MERRWSGNARRLSHADRAQIELLQLDRGEIRVAEYLVELPPKGLLEAKLRAGERTGGRSSIKPLHSSILEIDFAEVNRNLH